MIITNHMDVNMQTGASYATANQPVVSDKAVRTEAADSAAKVSLSTKQNRGAVLSDEELQCAVENVLSLKSNVYDVRQAEEMIAEANRHILEQADEAVLAQANQTPPVVTELTQ